MNCTTSSFSGAYDGCPENIGGVKGLLIAVTDPGILAVSDLQDATYVQTLLSADEPDRIYRLTDSLNEAVANNTIVTYTGTYRTIPMSEQAGVSMYKFEASLCLKYLYQALKFGKECWIAYITEKNYLGVQTIDGDPLNVRFIKVNLTATEELPTATTPGLIAIGIEKKNLNSVERSFPFVNSDDITSLEKILFTIAPVSDGDATVELTAIGCDLLTPITDLTIGADGVNKFEIAANGALIPGAVAQVGNVYTFTRTAGTFTTGEVVTGKYENPSTSGEFYTSTTATTTVIV